MITRLNVGGPAIHAAILSSRLGSPFETLLVSGREGADEGSMVELGRLTEVVRPVRVRSLGREIFPVDDLRAVVQVTRIARRFRPHVVHTHLAKAGFVGRIAARLSGARVVLHTYHGSVLRGYFGPRESGVYLGIERWLARVTTRLIAITPRGRRELVELGIAPEAKVVVIPLGLDLDPLRAGPAAPVARSDLGLAEDAVVVGIVGRLAPIKDVGTFLRAVALARADVPRLVALVVGDGSERPALEHLARSLDLGSACRFLGFRADIPRVLAALDVLALTSLNEGSPVAIIEGMAAGKAVVATGVGGVPDVVSDGLTGLLVPPADPGATAAAIVRLLRERPLRERLGSAASASVYPRFAAGRLIRDIEALYTDLLDAAR